MSPENRPLRILLATPPVTAIGPIPRVNALLAAELEALGCEVTLADWGSDPSQSSAARRALRRFEDMAAIWRKAGRSSCDVVVIATGHHWNTLARDILLALGLRVMRRPAAIQFHGSEPWNLLAQGRTLFKFANRLLLASTSGVMVLSAEERRNWERFRPRTRVFVVKNPYRSTAGDSPKPDVPPADPPLLLFAGRISTHKGVLDLVEAAARLAADHPERPFRLVMAGSGAQAGEVAALAEKLGVADRIDLPGQLDAESLSALYRQATLFVLPSHMEGFPTVLSEAMDAGLPLVTTSIPGTLDYLVDGENALFVPPRDPARLAEALATLLADPALRARMAENNRARIAIFAPARVTAEYLDVLHQILSATAERS